MDTDDNTMQVVNDALSSEAEIVWERKVNEDRYKLLMRLSH